MTPRLAVVIPTFDRAATLPRAIDSVLSQATDDVEIIVVDDGSTDSTPQYLRSLTDPRVRVIRHDNLGVSAARNTGVNAASADFVTFLDSDDEARPGWLDAWLSFVNDGVDLASCAVARASPHGDTVERPRQLDAAFGGLRVRMLAGAYCIRRELLLEVGGFRAGLELSENTDLALRLGGKMLVEPFRNDAIDEALVTVHPSLREPRPQVRFDSAATILEHDRVHLDRSPDLLATYAAIAGVAASRLGRRSEARSYLALAIKTRPVRWRNYLRWTRTWWRRSVQEPSR